VPTVYPKSSPTEVLGLLVLLKDHKGSEDVARLADDLDLEIDEILPSTEFAEALGLIRIAEGRATMTETGTRLMSANIRERKNLLREQLRKTTLFKTLVQALESKPERQLTAEELMSLVEFTTAPADEFVQNIINWGRYAELFRYDPDQRLLLPSKNRAPVRSGASGKPPGGPGASTESRPGTRSPTAKEGANAPANLASVTPALT
jgi:NitT/TauT family transport system ATP-binding protein